MRANLDLILRAFRYRNYRLFFGGQIISLVGTWMQQIAVSWLVYRLTNSAFLLGIVGFSGQIPMFIVSPFAGVLVDRISKHRILIITQVLASLQAFILTFLIMAGTIRVWHIVALTIFLGIISAFDAPARQAFVFDMVTRKEDLGNAIALNSLMFNSARMIGPFIAGVLIATVGEGACFFINGLSYIAVIAALLAMNVTPRRIDENLTDVFRGLKEGLDYVFSSAHIKAILSLLALVSLTAVPYVILMPIFATNILGGGPKTLGLLMSASGIGAAIGGVYLASRKSTADIANNIIYASSIFGTALAVFSLSRVLWISLPVMLLAGFGMMVHMTSSNTILQTIIEDDKRGRVMSFFIMAFMGMMPFGSLIAGSLAGTIGAPNTLLIGGLSCIAGSLALSGKITLLKKSL